MPPLQKTDGPKTREQETGGPDAASEALRKRSMTIAGHRTSLSLEEAFWRALKEQAAAERLSIAALVAKIDRARHGNLSSAVRVYLLQQVGLRGPGASSREFSSPDR